MKTVCVGMIGSGFMAHCHSTALRAVGGIFPLPVSPVLEMLADEDAACASEAARHLGYARATSDWHALVADAAVDLVSVTTPNHLHAPMALAAIEAGKAVWCEKPLAPTAAAAKRMAETAAAAGVATMVGFNYLKNPMALLAREIVQSGEIGEITGFRGIHAEDYMADPTTPYSWRLDPENGAGVVADLGSHIVALARMLAGEIDAVCGQTATIVAARPVAAGSDKMRPVQVPDVAHALLRFASGTTGSIEASWVAQGRKLHLAAEVTGTKGSILLDYERMNELRLFTAGPQGRQGFRTILAGPEHPFYGAFCPAPGHQLGFNDLKTIEARVLLDGISGGPAPWPDFTEGWQVQRVVDAIVQSATEQRWVAVAEV